MEKFQCSHCCKEYLHRKGLQRHVATAHEAVESFTCDICSQSFGRRDKLNRHKLIHESHAEVSGHECDECQKVFSRRDKLNRHKKSHQLKRENAEGSLVQLRNVCGECGKAFARRDNLVRHKRTHSEKISNPTEKVHHNTTDSMQSETIADMESSRTGDGDHENDKASIITNLTVDEDLQYCLRKHWSSIETRFKCQRVLDIFNFRLVENTEDISDSLMKIWRHNITCRIKVNCSPGFVLQHKTSGELRYFHSSSNNACIFDKPVMVRTESELSSFTNQLLEVDILERVRQRRPNTAWGIRMVTNMTFYIAKILPMGKVGRGTDLPNYIVKHKGILPLHKDKKHCETFKDNLCFFRCLAIKLLCRCREKCFCLEAPEKEVTKLFKRYRQLREGTWTRKQFRGVGIKDLLLLEKIFGVSITVFQLEPNGSSNVIWSSKSTNGIKLLLNLHDKHFSLIKRLDIYARSYDCDRCQASFDRLSNYKRHVCSFSQQRLKFSRQIFSPSPTVFDEMGQRANIIVEAYRRFYPYRITYDIECFMSKEELPSNTDRLVYTSKHQLLSISTCSNVPGYTEPQCFISEGSDVQCIEKFMDYISRISARANEILVDKYSDVLELLHLKCQEQSELEDPFKDAGISHPVVYASRSLNGLQKKFAHFLPSIPVVGFNSQRYDLNVMKGPLLKFLHQRDKIKFTIKRESKMQCVETDQFRFLDISNFIAPGFSYDKYLKAYDCAQEKGFFPYEWFDSLDKLEVSELPPHSAFYSSLTQSNISEAEYRYCLDVRERGNMETMRDFLIWYNNLDVVPFLEALEKQTKIYEGKGIDMLKSAILLPGLAVRWLFTEVDRRECEVALIDEQNKDLHHLIKENLVGGPSIVFHRYHEKDSTKIREIEYGTEARMCSEILGVDANALYLWSMMQDMPTGFVVRRKAEEGFVPKLSKKFGKKALGWLEWVSEVRKTKIEHEFNQGERRIGQHGIPVDGFCASTNTVYQFHGCLFHGHQCQITAGIDRNPFNGKTLDELRLDTELKEDYIRALGYGLERIYECQWDELRASHSELEQFLDEVYHRYLGDQRRRDVHQIIQAVKDGEIFGLIRCDVRVPTHLRRKFSEMPPVFRNISVSRHDLSEHMAQFAESSHHLKQPQRMLVGSMKGDDILLLSELVRWYLQEGLEVTNVTEIFQFTPKKCFDRFGQSVSEARRQGDIDISKSLLADTAKLTGNSVYGKTITNKEKHRDIAYCNDDKKASIMIKNGRFLAMDEIGDGFYEMMMEKKKVMKISKPE